MLFPQPKAAQKCTLFLQSKRFLKKSISKLNKLKWSMYDEHFSLSSLNLTTSHKHVLCGWWTDNLQKSKDIKMALKLLKRWSTSPREVGCKLKLHGNIISYLSDGQTFKSLITHLVGEAVGKQEDTLTNCWCQQWKRITAQLLWRQQNHIYNYLEIHPEGTPLTIQKYIYTRLVTAVFFVIVNYWESKCLYIGVGE